MMCWPGLVAAWQPLDGAEITAALTDRSLAYDQYTLQHFHKNGATDYITERFSSGRWSVRGDQYCSTWPPSETWTCYDVDAQGDSIRFTGADGIASVGTYTE